MKTTRKWTEYELTTPRDLQFSLGTTQIGTEKGIICEKVDDFTSIVWRWNVHIEYVFCEFRVC